MSGMKNGFWLLVFLFAGTVAIAPRAGAQDASIEFVAGHGCVHREARRFPGAKSLDEKE
jgi:hypothetical protein